MRYALKIYQFIDMIVHIAGNDKISQERLLKSCQDDILRKRNRADTYLSGGEV